VGKIKRYAVWWGEKGKGEVGKSVKLTKGEREIMSKGDKHQGGKNHAAESK